MPDLNNTEFVNFREKKATADISDLPAINDVVVNVDITTEPGKAIVMFESGKILKVENVTQEPVQVPVQEPVQEPGAGDLGLNLNIKEPIVEAGTIILGKNKRKKIIIDVVDMDNKLENLLKHIQQVGNVGHSFDILVDPDPNGETKKFGWDGDGSDYIKDIKVEEVNED